MSVRRNNIQGTNKVTWGFLGKRTSYVNQSFERVPELTEEERRKKLVENLNSWSVSKTKKRIDFAPIEDNYARGGTDVFSPPIPVETFNLQTAQLDNLQTAGGDNILWTV